MKKTGILNSDISGVVSKMGHLDMLCVVDLGYPIPEGSKRIDLVVKINDPDIFDVLYCIMSELYVEKVIVASESSEEFCKKVTDITGAMIVEKYPHLQFKEIAKSSRAFIRTGTALPYHNVILVSGVIF